MYETKEPKMTASTGRQFTPARAKLIMLGAGHLCQMTSLAGLPLNVHVLSFDPDPKGCARIACKRTVVAEFDDASELADAATGADAVAIDTETVPSRALRIMLDANPRLIVMPGVTALKVSQSRLAEKREAGACAIRTLRFWEATTKKDLHSSRLRGITYPCFLKTDRNGYDGKGQRRADNIEELEREFEALGNVPCIIEEFVKFDAEISVIVVRDRAGNMSAYKPFENIHHGGILRHTIWPGRFSTTVIRKATGVAMELAEHLEVLGLLTVKMFVVGDDVLFNEIAPRPHNSGLITMKCAATSQFEQICRIARGMPIGSCEPRLDGVMTNMIGGYDLMDKAMAADWSPFIYGKDEPRPGRKLGHLSIAFPRGSMKVVIGGDDGNDILALPKLFPVSSLTEKIRSLTPPKPPCLVLAGQKMTAARA